MDKAGAELLRGRISGYWSGLGHQVDVRIEFLAGSGIWVVRSSLARGLPPPAVT